jgi:ABC-type Mn2+/Zn2+ transport system permease subunit
MAVVSMFLMCSVVVVAGIIAALFLRGGWQAIAVAVAVGAGVGIVGTLIAFGFASERGARV